MANKQSEAELINLARAGDEAAYGQLFNLYRYKVQQVVLFYIPNRAEAEDVVQEVFIKAFAHLDQFQGKSSFFTWLYRIGANSAKNTIAKQSVRVPLQDVDIDDAVNFASDKPFMRHISSPEKECAKAELKIEIYKQIDNVPAELSEVLYMREIAGMAYADISQVIECPVGTVRSRLHRAREQLKLL